MDTPRWKSFQSENSLWFGGGREVIVSASLNTWSSVIYDHLRKDKWFFLTTPYNEGRSLVPWLCPLISTECYWHLFDKQCSLRQTRTWLGVVYICCRGLRNRRVNGQNPSILIQRSALRENGTFSSLPSLSSFFPSLLHPFFLPLHFSPCRSPLPVSHSTLHFLSFQPFLFPLPPNHALSLK